VFEFAGQRSANEVAGTLVGEFAPNGALCVITADGDLWPIYNPRRPTTGAPKL
jgi:hypothetical protein